MSQLPLRGDRGHGLLDEVRHGGRLRMSHAPYGRLTQCAGLIARAASYAAHAVLAARGQWITNAKTLLTRAGLRDLFDCPVEHVNSYGTAAVGSGHYARLQPWARFPPSLWNGSWNGDAG